MKTKLYKNKMSSAIILLENKFGGVNNLIRAAFESSFFVCPNRVKEKTPWFPDRARYSKTHYPGKKKNEWAEWNNRKVKLDDNQYAQNAWKYYIGREIMRKSGYGLRHIWGHPWNPDAFTAGWNFCYMPFWVGMLTENQHPHQELKRAFCQASWNLYFAENSVCSPLDFVQNPNYDLDSVLCEQPVLILSP